MVLCTESIIRHQDVCYEMVFQEGKGNKADYMSRHAKSLVMIQEEEQNEADDLNNLLYLVSTTPIVDYIGYTIIAKRTKEDPVVNKLLRIVINGKTRSPKSSHAKLQKFKQILQEITVAGNGVLYNEDCIIPPETLQSLGISPAHNGCHPMQRVISIISISII